MSIDTKEIEKRTATRLGMSWGQVSNILQVYADEFVKASKPPVKAQPAVVEAAVNAKPPVKVTPAKAVPAKPTKAQAAKTEKKAAETAKEPAKAVAEKKAPAKRAPRKAAAPKANSEGEQKKEEPATAVG